MTEARRKGLRLSMLAGRFAVCKLRPDAKIDAPDGATFFSVTRTPEELSVVCDETDAPESSEGVEVEGGWRALKLEGPFEFSFTGVISSVASPLADAGVPVFVLSTFDTDYVLVKEEHLQQAAAVLESAGHIVEDGGRS